LLRADANIRGRVAKGTNPGVPAPLRLLDASRAECLDYPQL